MTAALYQELRCRVPVELLAVEDGVLWTSAFPSLNLGARVLIMPGSGVILGMAA
jgi:hypothetical protein